MKFNKDNVQKLVLAAMVVLGGLYYYFSEMLGPLDSREAAALKAIPELEPRIKDAKRQISQTKGIEVSDPNAAAAREALDVIKASISDSPSITWFPQTLSDFFRRQGIPKVTFHPNSAALASDPDLTGYKATSWTIDIPQIEFVPLAIAIAGLENQLGLMQITSMQIEALPPPEAQYQHVQLTISTIVKQ